MQLPPPLKSASHPLARQARSLARGVRERREEGLFLIEGPRGIEEALAAKTRVVWVLVAASKTSRPPFDALLERCSRAGFPIQPVQDQLLERISPSEQGPGLVAACPLPPHADDPDHILRRSGLAVVVWKVQHPGNVGTLIRSAAAFGACGLISAGGADPWTPKAVRASAGAIHRLPLARTDDPAGLLEKMMGKGRRLIAALARGGTSPEKADWSGDCTLLLGSEVAGLPPEVAERALGVTIPALHSVESLSVAVAGSLLCYVASRQSAATAPPDADPETTFGQ